MHHCKPTRDHSPGMSSKMMKRVMEGRGPTPTRLHSSDTQEEMVWDWSKNPMICHRGGGWKWQGGLGSGR
jgi:hypothetical protein